LQIAVTVSPRRCLDVDEGHRSSLAPEAVTKNWTRLQRVSWRKLAMLDAAEILADLRVPPGNRLEKLAGDRVGQYSIPDQPAVADLLPVDRRRTRGRGDHRLPLTKEGSMAANVVMGPVHPGEILLEEFLRPLAVSQYQLAKEIAVPARRISEIVHGQRRPGRSSIRSPLRRSDPLGPVRDGVHRQAFRHGVRPVPHLAPLAAWPDSQDPNTRQYAHRPVYLGADRWSTVSLSRNELPTVSRQAFRITKTSGAV
jgi:hypothetical protein